jgi:glycosyltransferase involved in cell wall biosynthesis
MSDQRPSDSALKKRIVFFGSGLPMGGAETHMIQLREGLEERGWPSDLLLHGWKRSEALMQARGAHDPVFLNIKGMTEIKGWFKTWLALRRLRPDIIIAINQTPLIIAIVCRWFFAVKSKIICIFHTMDMQERERHLIPTFRRLSPFCDLAVYVSENQRRLWTERGIAARTSEVVHNGVDASNRPPKAEARDEIRRFLNIREKDYVVGLVATFRDEKNQAMMVEAMADLRARDVPVKAILVGGGPNFNTVKAKVVELALEDRVFLVGEKSDPKPFMAACDVGVLSSSMETFPIAAIEFLSCGRPMIACDVGGVREIVEHGHNGLLYEVGRRDLLVNCIEDLAQPDRLAALSANARASTERFGLSGMIDKYYTLIQNLAPAD